MSYPAPMYASRTLPLALAVSACTLVWGCELVGGIEDRELEPAAVDGGSSGTGGTSIPCNPVSESDHVAVDPNTNHCYRLDIDERYWDQAETDCAIHESHLVTIGDADEQLFIAQMLTGIAAGGEDLDHVLIGLRQDGDGPFTWVTGSGVDAYDSWHSGEPNAEGSPACAFAFEDNLWEWHDDLCEGVRGAYLCEQP